MSCKWCNGEWCEKYTITRFEDLKVGTASLDRIDSKVGYVIGNVQWVHKNVNIMKQSIPQDRFIELCKKIVKYRGG